jgi:probable HAF family extracellular repeat protein
MQDLGIVRGAQSSLAQGINNRGQAVGAGVLPFILDSFWRGSDFGMHRLTDLIQPITVGINPYGEVVGWNITVNGTYEAFLWTANDGLTELGNLGGSLGAQAHALNDAGQVAGTSAIP